MTNTIHTPTVNNAVYDIFWHFTSERMNIFYRRLNGQPAPWTDDAILEQYKFCNVYRASDRISQYLIRDIIYNPTNICEPADKIFQIVAFRFFSKESTWDGLTRFLDHQPTIADLASGDLERAFDHITATGEPIFTNSFILCASNHFGRTKKHLNYIELFKSMFLDNNFAERALSASSLRELYHLLHSYPMIGDFMSYQIAIDLNYSDLINFSENDFTKAGPGAVRGIKKVFPNINTASIESAIYYIIDHQEDELAKRGIEFPGLFGRPLHAIDVQNLFCEVDKYTRVAMPELPSNRTKIKNKFHANPRPIAYKFPPKWGLAV